ncbi:DUF4345 domain-containing protein [Nocardia sp. NPDC057440]|uniref:DUF4345 domain-containing protein n=1 Tax=Nocardia sp. NPDC057440 TaxID=3346134 RepID=UPI00366F9DE8
MRTAAVVTIGVMFCAMGVFALLAPAALARPFDIRVETPKSRSEIRAVYGGFGIAVAAMLWWAAAGSTDRHAGMVIAVGIALAGMACGRLVSRLLDTATPFYPIWFYFCVEAVGAGLLIAIA